jgi:phosphinothricin acetyltransferase
MTTRIRSARADDAPEVAAIYAPVVEGTPISFEYTPPDAGEMAARIARAQERYPWIVAERNGALAGYAYASEFRARPAYRWTVETTVYVAAAARHSGVGHALMNDLLARLRAQGFHMAIAGITLPNPASQRLHEALGFTPVGRFRDAGHKFGAWHAVGFWELQLQPLAGEPTPPGAPRR